MTDFLTSHALKNVWCNPDQDNQIILKPTRITPNYGVVNSWKLMWNSFLLPEKNSRYHLYQIGQVHPLLINLFPKNEDWVLISDVCNVSSIICDIYLNNGIELPRSETWYMVTDEKNILIAVKQNKNIPFSAITQDVYIRLYKNAYFNTFNHSQLDNYIFVEGKTVTTMAEIYQINESFISRSNQIGGVYAFCNGYKVKSLDPTVVNIGDTVEYVFDSSIKTTIDFKINTLGTFDSTLDSKGKYLLHYKDIDGSTTIDYRDDIDLFVIDPVKQKGVRYHKNTNDSLRMVTHRDYSVPVSHVVSYIENHPQLLNKATSYIRMHIRHSGYERDFINEHNRIKELYKLSDVEINRALLGLDSTVANWRAPLLESSAYVKLMSSTYVGLSKEMITNGYGYNAISKLIVDSPVKSLMFSGQLIAPAPYFYQYNSTAFEYDNNGLLIDYHKHTGGELYNCVSSNCKYVEFIHGVGTTGIDEYHNAVSVKMDPNYDYRFYLKEKIPNVEPKWVDVTGKANYTVIRDTAFWLTDRTNETIVRSNKKFFIYKFNMPVVDGLFEFNLTNTEKTDDVYINKLMEIPMGELDIFLNGHHLTENLDYYLSFPRVVIVCKDYFKNNPLLDEQEIVIRFTGLCDATLNKSKPAEFGFIRNNVVSNNDVYNIRDDKVISIYIKGSLYLRDELLFNESNPNFTLLSNKNGQPYLIKDTVAPIKSLVNRDVYEFKKLSSDIDKSISDYITLKLPELDPSIINPFTEYHNLFSPFICKILFDLKNGILDSPLFETQYNDDQVRELIKPYLSLIKLDPTYVENTVNHDYIRIHPHHLTSTVKITDKQYVFLNRVTRLYTRNLVDLSASIEIV